MVNPLPGNVPAYGRGHAGEPRSGSPQDYPLRPGSDAFRGQGGGYEPASTSPKFTPDFVLRCMRRWWKVAAPIGMVFGLIVFLYHSLTFVPLYRSSAWLRIEDQSYIIYGNERSQSTDTFIQTQVQLIHSPLVLESVLARPDIASMPEIAKSPTPVNLLSYRLDVNAGAHSELFIIGYLGPSAQDSATVANAITESYIRMHSQDEASRSTRVIELLEDERARRMVTIQQMRDQLKELKARTQGPQGDEHVTADEHVLRIPMGDLHSRITAKEVEQELLKAQFKALDEVYSRKEIEIDEEAVDAEAFGNTEVTRLNTEAVTQRELMGKYLAVSPKGSSDPKYQALLQVNLEIERKKNELLDSLREKIRDRLRTDQEKTRANERSRFESRIASNQLEIDLLRERFFAQRDELRKAGGQSMDLQFKAVELGREEQVLDLISGRVMRLRTEMKAPAKITLMRKAEPPTQPDRAFPTNKVALYALVAFAVPFGLAVLWEKIVCRVDGPQQLWQADLTVVGEVARLPVSSRFSTSANSAVGRDVSLFEESIDSLRTCLVLSETGAPSRVLVVTSAVSGEGKTSVASQLAVSIARASGEPTLLIDADMRSPDIHNVFDIPNEPGLAQVLSRECSIDEAIITSWSNYVHIMPAGILRSSPHKLLGDGAIKNFMAEVSARYKHVIIDTSPILSASESLVLAKAADATLLCAMRDVSRVDQVQKAYERLLNIGARPLGTVLNGVPTNRYAYLYGVYAYSRD